MTSVFLQVRLDSSRLPRKALADLGGATVFERCQEALEPVGADARWVVTEPGSEEELRPLLREGWNLFVGPKDDVLARFVLAARVVGCRTIVRATGDNPLVSASLANLVLERHRERGADYSALDGGPVGSGVEVVEATALERAHASQPDAYEREHVCPHLYRRPEAFSIHRTPVPPACFAPDARITLDTAEDWAYLCSVWDNFGRLPALEELIPWLNRHPR